jgi:ABC-2 type transport system ATP-binding protein
MKKKLALTAILVQQNQFYILDEPFNGLDLQSNMVVMEIVKKLKALGKIVLVSSHVFATLNTLCDEIHLLKEGKLVAQYDQKDFAQLEQEMSSVTVSGRIEMLGLS